MVSIKVSNQGIPPILAAALRSVAAVVLTVVVCKRPKPSRCFLRGKDLGHGIAIGFLFRGWSSSYFIGALLSLTHRGQ